MRPTSSLCVEATTAPSVGSEYISHCHCPTTPVHRLVSTCEKSHLLNDRLRPRSPPTSSPLSKRTKLHRDRKCRNLNSLIPANQTSSSPSSDVIRTDEGHSRLYIPSQVSSLPTSSVTPSEDQTVSLTRQSTETSKSGILVVVSCPRDRSRIRSHPSDSRPLARCPSLVQVHRQLSGHWALVSRCSTRLTEKPQLLNLRQCRVTRTRAAQFTVHLNGAEGRVVSFEASSPELADQWVEVFSPVDSQINSRKILNHVKDVILEEDEEMALSPVSSPSVERGPPSYRDIQTCKEDSEDIFERCFVPQKDFSTFTPGNLQDKDHRVKETVGSTLSRRTNIVDSQRTLAWNEVVVSDVVKVRARTTSLPILYEEEEAELEP